MGRVALGLWCAFVVAVLVVLLVLGRFLTAAVAGGAGVLLTLLYAFTLSWMGKEEAPEQDSRTAGSHPPTAAVRRPASTSTSKPNDCGTTAPRRGSSAFWWVSASRR